MNCVYLIIPPPPPTNTDLKKEKSSLSVQRCRIGNFCKIFSLKIKDKGLYRIWFVGSYRHSSYKQNVHFGDYLIKAWETARARVLLTRGIGSKHVMFYWRKALFVCWDVWLTSGTFVYLYCTVLYYTVLYCTVLYCTVLYCTMNKVTLDR